MQKDSVAGTLTIAAILCVVCSVLVASAAVLLKPLQEANKKYDMKKNMLLSSGLLKDPKADKEEVLEIFEKVNSEIIDLATGEKLEEPPENFDQRKAAKHPNFSVDIAGSADLAKIKRRSKYARIYKVMDGEQIQMYILPVNGKGLWSTLYGFLAMSPDFQTVRGLGFYEHAETPGLGGEVDNPNWKAQWAGKKIYDENLEPKIQVIKGSVDSSDPNKEYKVDGLSGATITSNGVENLLRYWLGENGFKPFIENELRKSEQ